MNADRHALNAALDYAAKLEKEMQNRDEAFGRLLNENFALRRRLRDVREVLDDPPPPMSQPAYAEQPQPQGMTNIPKRTEDDTPF